MFICSNCERHFNDDQLQYTLLHHLRVNHPSTHFFLLRFNSRDCLVGYLNRISRLGGQYLLTDRTGPEPVEYEAATPRELLDRVSAGDRPVPAAHP